MTHTDKPAHVHFLGIGGVGVSGLARIYLARGYIVSGTDAKSLPVMDELTEAGAQIFVGYNAENIRLAEKIAPIDFIVASSIATPENPERRAAEEAGIPVEHRSVGLNKLMQGHRVITVAGTHGKTTTSSMAALALTELGADPSFAVGAAVTGLGVNAANGIGEWFVAEADESDGTLVVYQPDIAIVTNIEADHLDHYGTEELVHQVFFDHAQRIVPGGTLIYCADDPGARGLAQRIREELGTHAPNLLSYGGDADNDLHIENLVAASSGAGQTVYYRWADGNRTSVKLHLPGYHNASNAAAVMLAAHVLGVDSEMTARALEAFHGTARRFEFCGEAGGVRVFDDYAHHPTEVSAAIRAARDLAGKNKVHVVFQPHLFSRTQNFALEFAHALSLADEVYVLEIYPAREQPIPGVTSQLITSQLDSRILQKSPSAAHPVSMGDAIEAVSSLAVSGDIVLTLGAGDITQSADEFVTAIDNKTGVPNDR